MVGCHTSSRVIGRTRYYGSSLVRSCHVSLTEVSPTNKKTFAGRCATLPIPWPLDRRSIVPCVLPMTSIIPIAFLSSPGPLDVSKKYKVRKIRQTFWDVPIISHCEGPDVSSGMPRLVVPAVPRCRAAIVRCTVLALEHGEQAARGCLHLHIEKVFKFLGLHSDYAGKAMI